MKLQTTKKFPLLIEDHPNEYIGHKFFTMISYNDEDIICIVDNSDDKSIKAYVFDYCDAENIDINPLLAIAKEWYRNGCQCPISIEYAKNDMTEDSRKILKTLNISYIKRVIGPIYNFNLTKAKKIKRKKCKPITNLEIVNNKEVKFYSPF